MNPVDTLHRAAAKLREEANAAYGELCLPPWRYGNSWAGTQARYVATVHPGVGLLLADLLDWHAGELDSLDARPNDLAEYAEVRYARELAVARAILGDQVASERADEVEH